jgi:hypothetical protein
LTRVNRPQQLSDAWPLPEDKVLLHKAAVSKKPKVTFSNGTQFKVKYYKKQTDLAWGDTKEYDVIYISPVSGFVPCGWFIVKRLVNGE